MRISEKIEEFGYFWEYTCTEKQIPGILKISEKGTIELKVYDLFDDVLNQKKPTPKKICGVLNNGKKVTLIECFLEKSCLSTISTSSFIARFAFFDMKIDNQNIQFSKITFSVEGLNEWLGVCIPQEFIHKDNQIEKLAITYSPFTPIEIKLNDNDNLKFSYSWNFPFGSFLEAKITHRAWISVESKNMRPYKELIEIATKITKFLCFATDETVMIQEVLFYSKEYKQKRNTGSEQEIPVNAYFQALPNSDISPKLDYLNYLFKYQDIKNELPIILQKWLEKYSALEPAFNSYFAVRYGAYEFLDGAFLSLIQGLETLHRRTSDKAAMNPEEFENLRNKLISLCPHENQDWLKAKLEHGNEPSLRTRIKELITPFKELFGTKEEHARLIHSMVDTRNYLIHFDKRLEKKMSSGKNLMNLYNKMECLFHFHFFLLIGFSEEKIIEIAKKNSTISFKLGLGTKLSE